ncbi:SagB/ThcOx family dehydrogenase [Sphingomonas qomolangmaensis]|uniref:SagB/ThcOx family dehydrogenase n=1 Tax=Sphingomonas qomolangmaensis TaxID=2918765 RepID=A0ABY5L9G3_9SPHN|nr:SagB/ThcOx family dehydrogenase [Sphingomonas qomolangmaensis]UUL82502.1 SagB/ThcOx family dehydrogenase [Sphingomonas qomolangmaensis]
MSFAYQLNIIDPSSIIEPYLSPLGHTAPEMEEIETFHEATKLKSFHEKTLGRRIGTYLTERRAIQETACNFKSYLEAEKLRLPPPATIQASFSDVLAQRHSCRAFDGRAITLLELSQMLSAVRATRKAGTTVDGLELWFRPYPSGGGLYPSEIYVVVQNVADVEPGLFHYDARRHELSRIGGKPRFSQLRQALGDEDGLTLNAGVIVLVSTLPERTVVKYAYRGYRFAMMEAGMIPFAINLAAAGIGLDALHWGGFLDDRINGLLGLDGLSETIASCLIVGGAAK